MGGFGWYLDKNHKHHHLSMSFTYFLVGIIFLFFVNYFSSNSVFFAILCLLLGSLSFVCSVYHIKEQIKKNRLKKENKTKSIFERQGLNFNLQTQSQTQTLSFSLSLSKNPRKNTRMREKKSRA